MSAVNNNPVTIDRQRLYFIGNLSLFMIGLGFAVRANIAPHLQGDIFDALDLSRSASMVGEALGVTFTGFAFTLLFGSALVDLVGIKRMLLFSALSFMLGSLLLIMVSYFPVEQHALASSIYYLIITGFLLTGLGWGAVEAASNPMITALFPDDKTHRLNVLHAWWPAGIVVGGLLGTAIDALGIAWQFSLVMLILPSLLMAVLVVRATFPQTQRVQEGISYADMFKEVGRKPMFTVFFLCMMLTAATELAPGQWVDLALSNVVGMRGILILVYVSLLMFVMRHFAGFLARRFSSTGLLWLSCLLASIGLFSLSAANSPATALIAATVWGVGVCYLYPTMLAAVSERFPRGGALFLGLMGFAAGISIQFVLPYMGAIFDSAKIEAAGSVEALATLAPAELDAVIRYASVQSFRSVAFIPLLLLPVFGLIWLWDTRVKKLPEVSV